MLRSQKRLLALVLGLPVLIVMAALIYMLGMVFLEGDPRGFWQALGWAGETLSTTGYGADTVWRHPLMVVFVVLLQFVGVFLVFLIFPVYLIPFLEERFEAKLPKEAPPMRDHVVIYRYGPAVATLVEELEKAKCGVIVAESDAATARRLMEDGLTVVYGLLDDDLMRKAHLSDAKTLIANGSDDENAVVILSARQLRFRGATLAMVEEPFHRRPMMLAGATAAYTPRHILGAALAARASRRISPTLAGIQQLGRKLQVSEVRVQSGSELAGRTLGEAEIAGLTGVTVIGQWVEGGLSAQPTARTRLEAGAVVIVVGGEENIARFRELCGGTAGLRADGPFIVCGFGEVGRKVVQLLKDAGERVHVIDREAQEGVDTVADVLHSGVFETDLARTSQAVVLALDSDTATLFATVIVKDAAPETPVIARVNRAENVERIHGAGAEFALSISQVSGQMLARRLLGEESIALDPQLKLLRVSAAGLIEHNARDLAIRERTGCSVVAIERGEELRLEFDPQFRFQAGDAVYIAGSSRATRRFLEVFPQPDPAPSE